MEQDSSPKTHGFHHAGLNVADLTWAKTFFEQALGFEQVGELPEYPAVFLSDGTGMLTLWQAEHPETATQADRRKVLGLHHLALCVESVAALEVLHAKVAAFEGVSVEFHPEPLHGGPTQHMMFTIPGNIRLELIAPQAG